MGLDDATRKFLIEIAQLRPILVTRARRLCLDEAAANDLVQDALERALTRRTLFREGSPLAWITRIMRNLFIDECRRYRRYVDTPIDQLVAPEVEPTLIEEVLDTIDAADLRVALGRLSPFERELFELAYIQGWPHNLIAARLGLRLNTAGTRLFRVKRKVRTMLQALLTQRTAPVVLRPLAGRGPGGVRPGAERAQSPRNNRPVASQFQQGDLPVSSLNSLIKDRRRSASG